MQHHAFYRRSRGLDRLDRVLQGYRVTHDNVGFNLNQITVKANRVTNARNAIDVIADGNHMQDFLVRTYIWERATQQAVQQLPTDIAYVIGVLYFFSSVQRRKVGPRDASIYT